MDNEKFLGQLRQSAYQEGLRYTELIFSASELMPSLFKSDRLTIKAALPPKPFVVAYKFFRFTISASVLISDNCLTAFCQILGIYGFIRDYCSFVSLVTISCIHF